MLSGIKVFDIDRIEGIVFDANMKQSLCQLSNQLAFLFTLFVSLDVHIREDRKVNVKLIVDCITNLENKIAIKASGALWAAPQPPPALHPPPPLRTLARPTQWSSGTPPARAFSPHAITFSPALGISERCGRSDGLS